MMRLMIPIMLFLVISCSDSAKKVNSDFKTEEQLFKGHSKSGNYLCYLKILPDNKILFIYQTEGNTIYGEHSGTIKAINDTTFHASCELTFGQFICKAPTLDSLTIFVDPSLINPRSILVRYENEALMNDRKISKKGVSFAFNPYLFNERTPASILTDHIHPITKEALTIKAIFGSAYDFVHGDKTEFSFVVSGDSLYSIDEDAAFQSGSFRMKRK